MFGNLAAEVPHASRTAQTAAGATYCAKQITQDLGNSYRSPFLEEGWVRTCYAKLTIPHHF